MNENFDYFGEVQIVYNTQREKISRKELNRSDDAAEYVRSKFDRINYVESAFILGVSSNLKPLGYAKISEGGKDGTVMDVRVIFQHLLKMNASRFFLFHNHPSGYLKPSNSDLVTTDRIRKAANILNIQLLDHIILSPDSNEYYSMNDNGNI